MNDKYSILIKPNRESEWVNKKITINTPSSLFLTITSNDNMEIKKIIWGLGDDTKVKSYTNRGKILNGYEIEQKVKKSHNETLSIFATAVLVDDSVVIPDIIEVDTFNSIIKERYVNPDLFRDQIVKYYDDNIFTNEIAESIYKIANRLAFAGNFINYTYREEMIGDAVVKMIEALTKHKFNPQAGNPFAYFTTIAFNAFCNRIKREKKERETLVCYREDVYTDLISKGILPYERGCSGNSEDGSDNSTDIVIEDSYAE